jgi:hypothetical protein
MYFFVSIFYASADMNVKYAPVVFAVFLSAERVFNEHVLLKARLWLGSPKERVSFEDIGAGGTIILKLVFKKN